MAPMVGEMGMICTRFKPHIFMVLIHVGYMIMYLITDAAFSHGMNPHIFVTYRHVLGGLVMFPFAYFLERYGSNLHPIHIHIHSHTGYMNNYLPCTYSASKQLKDFCKSNNNEIISFNWKLFNI